MIKKNAMVHKTAAKSSHRQNEITSDNGMKTLTD